MLLSHIYQPIVDPKQAGALQSHKHVVSKGELHIQLHEFTVKIHDHSRQDKPVGY
jgi:hypothetical protein